MENRVLPLKKAPQVPSTEIPIKVCNIPLGSNIEKYFLDTDEELLKEYDFKPADNEN